MVGIIPKPRKRIPEWYKFAFYIALTLLIGVILSYAALFYFESRASTTLMDLEDQISQVGGEEEKVLEREVITIKEQINTFSKIFPVHKKPSSFFTLLEENCHSKVWFTELELRPDEAEVSISGKTLNFQTLGQQFLIFQGENLIEEIALTSLAIGKEGDAEFVFRLSLNPEIFK